MRIEVSSQVMFIKHRNSAAAGSIGYQMRADQRKSKLQGCLGESLPRLASHTLLWHLPQAIVHPPAGSVFCTPTWYDATAARNSSIYFSKEQLLQKNRHPLLPVTG